MKPTKSKQIAQRRAEVLLLSSFGFTQLEISDKLITSGLKGVSQKNISRNIDWLKKHSVEYVKKNGKELSSEYQKAITTLYHIKKKAKERFDKAEAEEDDKLMIEYGKLIVETTNDIMNYQAVGKTIDAELVKEAKEEADNVTEKMKRIMSYNDIERTSQAKF